MLALIKQIKWQFLIFQRNNLIAMMVGITIFYMLVIYLVKDIGNSEKFLTLLIISDPSLIGFIFIGFSIILEKDQGVLSALFITPINHHYFLLSKVITLSMVCLFCALGMVFIAKGFTFDPLHFSVGILSTSIVFSFVGIFLVSFTTEILHYILRSIPLIVLLSLPIFNFFEFTDIFVIKLFPMQGSLYLIANAYREIPIYSELVFGYLSTLIWIPLLYWFVFHRFRAKIINS